MALIYALKWAASAVLIKIDPMPKDSRVDKRAGNESLHMCSQSTTQTVYNGIRSAAVTMVKLEHYPAESWVHSPVRWKVRSAWGIWLHVKNCVRYRKNYVKTFPAWKWNEGFFSVRFTCEKQPTQAGFWNYCKLCGVFFICGGFWYILHIILRKLSALRWSFFIYTLALFCGHFGSLKLNKI